MTTSSTTTTTATDTATASSSNSSSTRRCRGNYPIYVLYGSATGNAEHIAKNVAAQLKVTKNKGVDSGGDGNVVVCAELDAWKKKCPLLGLASSSSTTASAATATPLDDDPCTLIVVASTTGNGDPPENASRFVRTLKRTKTTCLPNVSFAVLGLGDTNYDQFCAVGKLLDKKLAELGATRLLPLSCADEATGLEEVVEPWTASVLDLLMTSEVVGTGAVETQDVMQSQAGTANATPDANANGATAAEVSDADKQLNGGDGHPIQESSDSTTTPPSLSIGAQTVKSLLGIPLDKPWDHHEGLSGNLSGADASSVSTPTNATMHHVMSNCELYHPLDEEDDDPAAPLAHEHNGHDDNARQRRKSRGMSLAEDTVSTASTGFLYHANHPYSSQVTKARYLTVTDPSHVLTDLVKLNDSDDSTDRIAATMDVIDKHFGPDINSSNSKTKRVLELTLQLPNDTTIEYAPGDSLGVVVHNPHVDVQFMLDILSRQGLQASTLITVDHRRMTVQEAVTSALDVSTPGVPRRILQMLALHTDVLTADDRTSLLLLSGTSKPEMDAYKIYVEKQRLTVVDVLREFPSTQAVPWRSLFGMLTGIPPRYYSVSSSPLVTPHSLTIAFSVVDYQTPSLLVDGHERGLRRIRGVATRYMEALVLPLMAVDGAAIPMKAAAPKLRIFPKPTTEFRLPASLQDPLILIGPGTGIAPFVGFVAHRQALALQRKRRQLDSNRPLTAAETVVEGAWRGGFDLDEHELPVTPRDAIRQGTELDDSPSSIQNGTSSDQDAFLGAVDVYFGCRHENHDWLYGEEMLKFRSDGAISNLYTAFSRDATEKVYVQHLMQRDVNHARIADLILNRGARLYLCGDGNAMAKDVQGALVEVLASQLPGGVDEALGYVDRMRHDRRFLMDIWG